MTEQLTRSRDYPISSQGCKTCIFVFREIKTEIFHYEKLKKMFADNSPQLQVLRHDKPLKVMKIHSHLSYVPSILFQKHWSTWRAKQCTNQRSSKQFKGFLCVLDQHMKPGETIALFGYWLHQESCKNKIKSFLLINFLLVSILFCQKLYYISLGLDYFKKIILRTCLAAAFFPWSSPSSNVAS